MFKRIIAAVALAAILSSQVPAGALANPEKDRSQQRDGQSRYEVVPLTYLPLVLQHQARMRVAMMVIMMQSLTYNLLMSPGVEAVNENRISVGGLLGGLFSQSYTTKDFLESLEVGSVYRAGDGSVAVALKEDMRLEDYRIIVFNGDYRYTVHDRPAIRQIDREVLGRLGALTMVTALLNHTLAPEAAQLMASLDPESAELAGLEPPQLHDLPILRELLIGKVYIGDDNTLLVVIPPAIVLDK